VRHPDLEDTVRVYVKGAPEHIMMNCDKTFGIDGRRLGLEEDQLQEILTNVMNEKYASKGLRVLAFAFKDIALEDFTDLKKESNNFASKVDRDILEKELTFVGLFALKNELRDKVKESILLANKGGINVRLVSGDNLETVKAVAIQAGIIT
jgi:magnesium-transporting ATPase (P-type)